MTNKTIEELESLKNKTHEEIVKYGMRVWAKNEKYIHYVYPQKWYDLLPEGLPIVSIMGEEEKFEKGKSDDEQRLGALSYGFIVPLVKDFDIKEDFII